LSRGEGRQADMTLFQKAARWKAGLVLLLALTPCTALAAAQISAVRVGLAQDHTRLVLESNTPIRYKLFSLRNPERVVLDLKGVELNAALTGLAGKVGVDHPYLKPIRVGRPGPKVVRLVLDLKTKVEPRIFTLKPEGKHGYRLVLDIYPAQPVGTAPPAPPPAAPPPEIAPRKPPTPAAVPPLETAKPAPPPLGLPLRRYDEPNLLLLEVRLDQHVLSDAIPAYQYGRNTFLPLGELARLLTLAIRTQPEQGIASGFVLREERSFSLNLAQATITLAGKTEAVDPALIKVQADDIYVASRLIARWLPLDLDIDLSSLSLRVRPRELLPLQARLERERNGAKAGRGGEYKDPGYPRHNSPYRLLGAPFIDQTLGVDFRRGNGASQVDARYTAYLAADLLGMESALFVSSSNQQNPSPEFRFTLGRHDPDAGLLGPLHARSFVLGSVPVPGIANIARTSPSGNGVTLSNRPLTQPTSFDRHSLQGDLPPGWDVELYFNDALVGYQQSRTDGKYNFDDQPLVYGPNEFRLVFHGPLGQLRVERQSFLLEQSIAAPGEFYYSLTEHRDEDGQPRSVAQFDWGLGRHLAATGGFVRLPVAGAEQRYANLGLRASWQSMIFSSDFARSESGGTLAELGLKTRVGGFSLGVSRAELNDFTSDLFLPSGDPVRTRDKIRIDGAIPLGTLSRLPVTVEATRDHLQSGTDNIEVAGRISAYLDGTSVTNQLRWQSFGDAKSADGTLQLSRRVGDIGLRSQINYTLKPESKLAAIALSADKRLAAGYLLNLGLNHSFDTPETRYTAGLSKSLGSFGLGISASYSSSGELAAGVQLFMAMGREPRKAEWLVDAQPKADTGAASVRVFLDKNMNGVMDAGEEPINNVGFTVNGGGTPARTDAAGIAWLGRLPVKQNVDIAVDTMTLEDPQWSPQPKGVRLVPRPGNAAQLDFPVIMTSEIDGTVYFVEKDTRRGIGDVLIELVNSEGKVVAAAKSAYDGYYIIAAVPPGTYILRISPEQIKELKLTDTGTRPITVLPDGTFVNGMDFSLLPEVAGNR